MNVPLLFITFHQTNMFANISNCICWKGQNERKASLFKIFVMKSTNKEDEKRETIKKKNEIKI